MEKKVDERKEKERKRKNRKGGKEEYYEILGMCAGSLASIH